MMQGIGKESGVGLATISYVTRDTSIINEFISGVENRESQVTVQNREEKFEG